jgi:transcriptional regulator GlxA family with amidase domain
MPWRKPRRSVSIWPFAILPSRISKNAVPEFVASLARVRHAITLGQQRGATWSQAAHAAGYFDQAHFNREFRAVTGEPPSTFLRATAYC